MSGYFNNDMVSEALSAKLIESDGRKNRTNIKKMVILYEKKF
jgi:hypothetical protein